MRRNLAEITGLFISLFVLKYAKEPRREFESTQNFRMCRSSMNLPQLCSKGGSCMNIFVIIAKEMMTASHLKRMQSRHVMEESFDEYTLSDQLIINRFRKHLRPDESDFYYVLGQEEKSTGEQFFLIALLGFILGPVLMTKTYFIGLTPQRLMLMYISGSFQENSFESIDLSEIGGAKVEDTASHKYITIFLRTQKKYRFKIEKSLYTVKKQADNLEKICQILTAS